MPINTKLELSGIPKLNAPADVRAKKFGNALHNLGSPQLGPLRILPFPTRLIRNVHFARGRVAVTHDLARKRQALYCAFTSTFLVDPFIPGQPSSIEALPDWNDTEAILLAVPYMAGKFAACPQGQAGRDYGCQ